MTVHELCLHKAGLLTWVLSSARVGLIEMNKEGLVSLPGKSNCQLPLCVLLPRLTFRICGHLLHGSLYR